MLGQFLNGWVDVQHVRGQINVEFVDQRIDQKHSGHGIEPGIHKHCGVAEGWDVGDAECNCMHLREPILNATGFIR